MRFCRSILLVAALGLVAHEALAQSGRIAGRVTDAADGSKLPGANIVVRGTLLGTAADLDGDFTLLRVPAGRHTIKVSFIGYRTLSREVEVADGQTARIELAMEAAPTAGEETVVLGVRARSQALALSQQKNASNIKNIIASDQIGRFPDASAPDALQRVPGVHVVRDQGEGRYVQIRGASPAMTSVTFNGERVPSPEGDVRQIALDAVPTEILESMEVSKAITPDMDADAIGGSVNLVTRRAPESGALSVEATSGYGSIREDASGKFALTWGDRLADGKLGLLFSASAGQRFFGSDDLESEYDFGDAGAADDELAELQVRHYTLNRLRRGFTGVVDYRLDAHSSLYLNGTWTSLHDDEVRRRLKLTVEDNELGYEQKDRLEVLNSWNFTVGGEHLLGNDGRLDYHVTASFSGEDTDKDNEIAFLQEDVEFVPDLSDADKPRANPAAGALEGDFEFDGFEPSTSLTENTDVVLAANYAFPLSVGDGTATVKAGAKYRYKEKTQDVTEGEYELDDSVDNLVLGQNIGKPFDIGDYNPGSYSFPAVLPSLDEMRSFRRTYAGQTEIDLEADVEDFEADEQTVALYAMAELNLGAAALLTAGARLERTGLDATGFAFDSETEELTPTEGSSDYLKVFPMVHLRYRLGPDTNVRAALTTAMQRPNFFALAPFSLRDDEDIELGNPELDPATATNLDLMAEHYFPPLGVVSGGLFYKRIVDPIFNFTAENDLGGDTVQPRNADAAWLAGVELAYQQQLRFLPGALAGLGFYGNYTYTASEATLGDGRDTDLAGQAQNVANAALSYELGAFSGQVSLNYHSEFIDEYGEALDGGGFTDVYIDKHMQIDLSASYRVNGALSLSLELLNLTNEPWVVYQTEEDRPIQREYYESWGWLGVKYNMGL